MCMARIEVKSSTYLYHDDQGAQRIYYNSNQQADPTPKVGGSSYSRTSEPLTDFAAVTPVTKNEAVIADISCNLGYVDALHPVLTFSTLQTTYLNGYNFEIRITRTSQKNEVLHVSSVQANYTMPISRLDRNRRKQRRYHDL